MNNRMPVNCQPVHPELAQGNTTPYKQIAKLELSENKAEPVSPELFTKMLSSREYLTYPTPYSDTLIKIANPKIFN